MFLALFVCWLVFALPFQMSCSIHSCRGGLRLPELKHCCEVRAKPSVFHHKLEDHPSNWSGSPPFLSHENGHLEWELFYFGDLRSPMVINHLITKWDDPPSSWRELPETLMPSLQTMTFLGKHAAIPVIFSKFQVEVWSLSCPHIIMLG